VSASRPVKPGDVLGQRTHRVKVSVHTEPIVLDG
jgi:hypothetical protein